ncbi:MAG TPA: DNA damage-inducible protein DinB [Anaerolineaceae bacterium]|nr:DNA damage-inducible protein DinB [Anaerolineaceae bacterium]
MNTISKPQDDEYPAYAEVYFKWVSKDAPLIEQLQDNLQTTIDLIRSMPEEKITTSFAPGEWSVKEIFGHMLDQERVLVYRALRFARGDETELATFDHEVYVKNSRANQRPLDGTVKEFLSIRKASISFYNSLDETAMRRCGMVGGNCFSVRALAWLTAGHEQHHVDSIKQNYM